MTPPLKPIAACLVFALAATIPLKSQQPALPRTTILLDPAHGGSDTGAHLANSTLEKDFTLAFATRLRSALGASGFTVISTRDSDPTVPFTTDQRAEIANQRRPTACLILHATASGSGVHIIFSALNPPDPDGPHSAIPWDTAQSASIPQSRLLANDLGLALLHAKLPVLVTRASAPPLNNLLCPAVAIEIAPSTGSSAAPITDGAYQQRIIAAITSAITSWRAQAAAAAAATTTGAAR